MFSFDHELIRRFGTLIAVIVATSSVAVKVTLYADEVEDLKEEIKEHRREHERLNDLVLEIQSNLKSRAQMDNHQNKMLEKHNNVLFVPKISDDGSFSH